MLFDTPQRVAVQAREACLIARQPGAPARPRACSQGRLRTWSVSQQAQSIDGQLALNAGHPPFHTAAAACSLLLPPPLPLRARGREPSVTLLCGRSVACQRSLKLCSHGPRQKSCPPASSRCADPHSCCCAGGVMAAAAAEAWSPASRGARLRVDVQEVLADPQAALQEVLAATPGWQVRCRRRHSAAALGIASLQCQPVGRTFLAPGKGARAAPCSPACPCAPPLCPVRRRRAPRRRPTWSR